MYTCRLALSRVVWWQSVCGLCVCVFLWQLPSEREAHERDGGKQECVRGEIKKTNTAVGWQTVSYQRLRRKNQNLHSPAPRRAAAARQLSFCVAAVQLL